MSALRTRPTRGAAGLTSTLAGLTALVLLFCLVSALNARATFVADQHRFEYHPCLSWLPHSYDSRSTWLAWWTYLGLAAVFWSARDWLLGKSTAEQQAEHQRPGRPQEISPVSRGQGVAPAPADEEREGERRPLLAPVRLSPELRGDEPGPAHQTTADASSPRPSPPGEEREKSRAGSSSASSTIRSRGAAPLFPARLRWLLWLLAINGTLLGMESIAQRLANSPRLLFLVKPLIHQTAETQFGPYAYRANGAAFFNLLWPVCLGFWWTLNRAAGRRRNWHHLWLLGGMVMAACPIISTSRAGAVIAVGIALLGAAFLLGSHFLFTVRQRQSRRARAVSLWAMVFFFAAAMTLGFSLGWERLEPRMRELNAGYEGREAMYRIAEEMAQDFPLFGTGPGTYESVSELYRPTQLINAFWPAQVHNDWLETRITFGWVGSLLLYASLLTVLLRWFLRGGIHGGRRFVMLVWLALGGCLLHARFDFPFQVHSILFLFVLLCAALFTLSRRP